MLIIWNVEENKEVLNWSIINQCIFAIGPNSKAGYILNDDVYINLDTCLNNFFFEHNFQDYSMQDQKGYRINGTENIILENGWLITKETIIELWSIDDLISEKIVLNSNNITLERIHFQVDGNTSIHFFALDYDTLNLILEYFDLNKQEYLLGILMKNSEGKSPIDIALDNESPRNVELLLRKLTLFKNGKFSSLFYDRFNELLDMNLKAFHEYLNSWLFQTIQMKMTRYLKLK